MAEAKHQIPQRAPYTVKNSCPYHIGKNRSFCAGRLKFADAENYTEHHRTKTQGMTGLHSIVEGRPEAVKHRIDTCGKGNEGRPVRRVRGLRRCFQGRSLGRLEYARTSEYDHARSNQKWFAWLYEGS